MRTKESLGREPFNANPMLDGGRDIDGDGLRGFNKRLLRCCSIAVGKQVALGDRVRAINLITYNL